MSCSIADDRYRGYLEAIPVLRERAETGLRCMPKRLHRRPERATWSVPRTLVAELSLDIDAAGGSASGHALRTCFLALRAAEALGMADREGYYYVVYAVNAVGDSPPSNEASAQGR